ncbi:MAG TPA: universal stress protein [Planctomycetaceae bacterium]|nr:universal stress protein [Planctomycetaceae bacterium]
MHGLQSILVGVNLHHGDRIASDTLGPDAQAALLQAKELARTTGAKLTLCAVLEISEQAFHLLEIDRAHATKTVEDEARQALERLAGELTLAGSLVTTVIRFGEAWEQLILEAQSGPHELVLVGTNARTEAARMLFGSTSRKLARLCPVPVWIAKSGEIRDVREIAVATDFSETAFAATQAAVGVAQNLQAKLFVVHALEFPFESYMRTAGVSAEEIQAARQKLTGEARERLQQELMRTDARALPHGFKMEVVEGNPDHAIPEFVANNEVDLLVIGTVGRSGLSGLLLGNTAERILSHLHASLLVIKPAGFVSPVKPA